MKIITNIELGIENYDLQSWSGATYHVDHFECIATIVFCFADEIPFIQRLQNTSFMEAPKDDTVASQDNEDEQSARVVKGIIVYDLHISHFVSCIDLKIHLRQGQLYFVNEDEEMFCRSKRQSSTTHPRFDMKIQGTGSIVVILFQEAIKDTLPKSLRGFTIRWRAEDKDHDCQVFDVESDGQEYEIRCKEIYVSWDVFPQYEY